MMFVTAILNFLGGGALKTVRDGILEARRDAQNAKNDHARIEAEKTIATLEAQQNILIAEQGSWMTRAIRPLFAAPFIVYNFKIIVWDKVLGLGTTDGLSVQMIELEMLVFGAYFLARPFEKWAKRRR